MRGGNCVEHGPGAKLKFKPGFKMTAGPGGEKTRTYCRKSYYECELDPRGKRKLKQTQLSFVKTTPSISLSTRDTMKRAGGDEPFNFSSSTPTVGQQTDCGRARAEQLGDEK